MIDFENLPLSRRRALGLLGGSARRPPPGLRRRRARRHRRWCEHGTGAGTSAGTADCVLMPEVMEGPYYLTSPRPQRHHRGPARPAARPAGHGGGRGRLEPIADAAVDVWHCDAGGVYSGGGGRRRRDLLPRRPDDRRRRRRRVPDDLPRLVPGRAVHIHVKVLPGAARPTRASSSSRTDDRCRLRVRALRRARRAGDRELGRRIYAETDGSTIVELSSPATATRARSRSASAACRKRSGSPKGAARWCLGPSARGRRPLSLTCRS